jgi:hypothetical protein
VCNLTLQHTILHRGNGNVAPLHPLFLHRGVEPVMTVVHALLDPAQRIAFFHLLRLIA